MNRRVEFGRVVHDIRVSHSWSQRWLGHVLARSESWVSKVESGAHHPSLDEFVRTLSGRLAAVAGETGAAMAERALREDLGIAPCLAATGAEIRVRRIVHGADPALQGVRRVLSRWLPSRDVPSLPALRAAAADPAVQLWVAEDAASGAVVAHLSLQLPARRPRIACVWHWVADDSHPRFGAYADLVVSTVARHLAEVQPGCIGAVLEVALDVGDRRRDPCVAERARLRHFARLARHHGWTAHEVALPYLGLAATEQLSAPGLPLILMYLGAPGAGPPPPWSEVRAHVYACLRESAATAAEQRRVDALERAASRLDGNPRALARLRDALTESSRRGLAKSQRLGGAAGGLEDRSRSLGRSSEVA